MEERASQRRDRLVHLRVGKEDTGLGRRSQRGLRSQEPLAVGGCGHHLWERRKDLGGHMILPAFSEYLDPLC